MLSYRVLLWLMDDGTIQVSRGDLVVDSLLEGIFLSGEIRRVDPQLCNWVIMSQTLKLKCRLLV